MGKISVGIKDAFSGLFWNENEEKEMIRKIQKGKRPFRKQNESLFILFILPRISFDDFEIGRGNTKLV